MGDMVAVAFRVIFCCCLFDVRCSAFNCRDVKFYVFSRFAGFQDLRLFTIAGFSQLAGFIILHFFTIRDLYPIAVFHKSAPCKPVIFRPGKGDVRFYVSTG